MTWRCAAHQPRFAPFHLRFHPLLRRSFGFSFCSLSFSPSASSYLCYTYFVNETSPRLAFLSLHIRLFSASFPRAVSPRPVDISISTFVALSNFHITTLSRNYVPRRCSLPVTPLPSSSFSLIPRLQTRFPRIPPRPAVHSRVCRFIRQTGRKPTGYYRGRRRGLDSRIFTTEHPAF